MEFPIAFAESVHNNDPEAIIPVFHPTEFPTLAALNTKTDSGWHFIQKQEAVDPVPKTTFTHTLTSVTDGENAWERLDYCSAANQGRPLYASVADKAISLPDPKPSIVAPTTKPTKYKYLTIVMVDDMLDIDHDLGEELWDMYKTGHSKGSARRFSGKKLLSYKLDKEFTDNVFAVEAERMLGIDISHTILGNPQPITDYKSVRRLRHQVLRRIQKCNRYVPVKSPREVYKMTGCNMELSVPLSLPTKLSRAIRCELL
ncbi:hypothetical protein J3Q64DRAFT_1726534 [Phycomyces blakesleeanus]|uniref:Uncharacterized protein n=2 Tax=Phycomyces blakesleeanus TaxID=4837 RepID=A0A162Q8F6_PHYB8|nr:hypothetical protein PHYBLDRAFT_76907 [Phycomyces blakesleeanus NRRL 1555(-)]OAD80966.1 hypothetical protein PHYBLDRAFT_76907 [Phycomyces blakesleeanus NRRL 1555(-)]|eukprot:XP_018299006.1 hypothetical protein PHYBLDRAFT_76907 [Phycomyces blakesleeanus NRRL 1555(-)]